jgi:hypothetical protein
MTKELSDNETNNDAINPEFKSENRATEQEIMNANIYPPRFDACTGNEKAPKT